MIGSERRLSGDFLENLDGILDQTGDDIDPVCAAGQRIQIESGWVRLPVGGGVNPTEEAGSDYQHEESAIEESVAAMEAGH